MSAHRARRGGSRAFHRPVAADIPRLVVDLVVAAIIAAAVLASGPGLGVIAWFGVPVLLLGLVWIAFERGLERRRRRRAARPR